ncbi:TVP38/TMEM64 family protein [Nocardiopsis lucentensis]|uniref:TVP38/TMEM64 family protein n=1 Tax=Nocardiopsis lucentensis TaxID=53441 RepID=UPI00034A99F4|nr:TVP38/TMEM64 family protein [Nocardiopsis lucentensis]
MRTPDGGGPGGGSGAAPRQWTRVAVFAVWLVLVAVAGRHATDLAVLRDWIDAAGAAGPAVYLLGYVVAVLLLVPRPLLNAVAGLVFATWPGIAVALTGGVLSALVQFGTARLLARDFVEARLPFALRARLDRTIDRHGLLAVIQLRLFPLVPFSAVNYGLGVTGLRVVPFAAGTALGGLPATVALVVLGESATDPLSPGFLACAALVAVLMVGSRVVGVYGRRSQRARTSSGGAVGTG